MAGFDFEAVWKERREFMVEGGPSLESKRAAGRPKDQLFLATHQDALEQPLTQSDPE
jgi:hypothetical protein